MSEETIPQQLREEYVVRKFGGAEPDACRPEDMVEEITLVIDRGVLISQTVTCPDPPPGTP